MVYFQMIGNNSVNCWVYPQDLVRSLGRPKTWIIRAIGVTEDMETDCQDPSLWDISVP
jgi:hypothetical protein